MLRSLTTMAALAWAAGACGGLPELEDPGGTYEQIRTVLRNFAIANEWHYSENGHFTTDYETMHQWGEWPADSVELEIWMPPEGQGWAASATHDRVGREAGCVLAWGDAPAISTPGGRDYRQREHRGRILCDEIFDAVTKRYGMVDR